MNEIELIRNLINLLSQKDDSPNQAQLTPVDVPHPDETDSKPMVFPLQQKMNFLKQLINPSECDEESDEFLQTIDNPIAIMISDENNEI